MIDGERRFCVVVHDVAGVFSSQVETIAKAVRPLIGGRFTCGIVPRWHGEFDSQKLTDVIRLCGECDEWLVHGMTHRRIGRGGLVSWLTNHSDEFRGLELSEIQNRVDGAAVLIQKFTEERPIGLVAPCWQLPVDPTLLNGIDYVMGYNNLVPCCADLQQVPLATWSYDWGRFRRAASVVNAVPAVRLALLSAVVPCVVIHPADVGRGWLPVAIRRIKWLMEREYLPAVPSQLLTKVSHS